MPWTLLAAACLALVAVVLTAGRHGTGETASSLSLVRSSLESPKETGFHLTGANPAPMAISPDGGRVVYGARDEKGAHRLYLQSLDLPEATPIPGTENAQYPFWSPDGRSVAYFADGALRVVDLEGRTNRELIKASDGKGGCWLPDDTILYTSTSTDAISRVDLSTGESTRITKLNEEPPSNSHRLPRLLPDGRHFLFAARKTAPGPEEPVAVMIGNLDGSPPRQLLAASGQAEYARGHLLYVVESSLFARPFDIEELEFSGAPVLLADEVGVIPGAALALFSASQAGALVYHPGHRETMTIHLAWYDAEGTREANMGEYAGFGSFDIAPDGQRVAFTAYDNSTGLGDLWLHDLSTDVRTRLTFEALDESYPLWSPDGRTLYYLRSENDDSAIVAFEPEGREEPREIHRDRGIQRITSISPDGRALAFGSADTTANVGRSFILPLDGSSAPQLIDETTAEILDPQFSPDGRWIAYASREGGSWKIYLKTYPLSGRKWQVTDREAFWYDWGPEGDRIYHQWSGNELLVTELDLTGATPRVGQTSILFDDFPTPVTSLHQFQVTGDGQRFLVSDAGGGDDGRPARLVVGWPTIVSASAR